MSARAVGGVAWAVQPVYVAVELGVAAVTVTSYDLVADTISELGAVSCVVTGVDPTCSPAHPAMNAAFVVFGVLKIVGAVLLRDLLRGRPGGRAAVVAWVVAGLCSAAVGFAPLDVVPLLHQVVAAPIFLAQPAAMVLTGRALGDRWAVVGGVLCGVAGVAFVLGLAPDAGGLLERVALWPAPLHLGQVGVRVLADHGARSRPARRRVQ